MMNKKLFQYFAIFLIFSFTVGKTLFLNQQVQVKYLIILFTIISVLLTLLFSQLILIFLIKLFELNKNVSLQTYKNWLYSYLFINLVFAFFIKNTIIILINPVLIVFLVALYSYLKELVTKEKFIVWAIIYFVVMSGGNFITLVLNK